MVRSAVFMSLVLAGAAAAAAVGEQCFSACFDQCMPRNEFSFCEFSCYDKCCPHPVAHAGGEMGRGHSYCIQSMCSHIDPGSKMVGVCRETCRKYHSATRCKNRRDWSTA